jgi:hypothetical protein
MEVNKRTIAYVLPILLFVLACGLFGGSKIFVKVAENQFDMVEKSSAFQRRKDVNETQFVIANYELDLTERSVISMKKLQSRGQMRVAFGIARDSDSPLKPGDYKDEKINWVDIYTFEEGREKVVSLLNVKGNILIGSVQDNEITGGIYIYETDKAVRGIFTAKSLTGE